MRVLSGIQSSGTLHLGNYFGMMKRMIKYQNENDLYCFIANYHALTTLPDARNLSKNTFHAACDFLALGLDPNRCTFWVQSDVPQVTELTWILTSLVNRGLLDRATSYKDKIGKGLKPNMGLYSYPILMAADILLFGGELVPVGNDQKQHLEMTREIANKFNNQYGEIFAIPKEDILEKVKLVPGTDGQKMSKSYNNFIDIFLPEKELRKQVMKIVTDAKALEDVKDPEDSIIVDLYSFLANDEQLGAMKANYLAGNYGYGHAKQALFEVILDRFGNAREEHSRLMADLNSIDEVLLKGAEKARVVAQNTLGRVRSKLGYLS